eukprot:m.28124 g.28124  ORF g.28124 m.28124 type:complete len:522 (+) comp4894_c0_seq1:110-1675(+)
MRTSDDNAWLLGCAFVVFTMQAGFAMLESGMVSTRHQINVLMKNLVDMTVSACMFFMFGWAFAFSDSGNSVVGLSEFFLNDTTDFAFWTFQFSFAAAAATIVSGAVAGRMRFHVYIYVSAVVSGVIYPFAARWIFSSHGWLNKMGALDFAGDGPVHLLGGSMGLMAMIMLGPRKEVNFGPNYVPRRSSPLNVMFGTFVLFWGWFAFNAGSSLSMENGADMLAGLAAVNTAVSSGGGTVAGLIYSTIHHHGHTDVFETSLASLASLVAVTGSCGFVQPWESFIIGIIGSILALIVEPLLVKARIDDPVGVVPVHAVAAIWGLLATGLFARPDNFGAGNRGGLFHTGSFYLLGVQALVVIVVIAWGMSLMYITIRVMRLFVSERCDEEHEMRGLDAVEHMLRSVKHASNGTLFEEVEDEPEVVFVTDRKLSSTSTPSTLERLARSCTGPDATPVRIELIPTTSMKLSDPRKVLTERVSCKQPIKSWKSQRTTKLALLCLDLPTLLSTMSLYEHLNSPLPSLMP